RGAAARPALHRPAPRVPLSVPVERRLVVRLPAGRPPLRGARTGLAGGRAAVGAAGAETVRAAGVVAGRPGWTPPGLPLAPLPPAEPPPGGPAGGPPPDGHGPAARPHPPLPARRPPPVRLAQGGRPRRRHGPDARRLGRRARPAAAPLSPRRCAVA